MPIKKSSWLLIVCACTACAPISSQDPGYKPSLVERVLSKKNNQSVPVKETVKQPTQSAPVSRKEIKVEAEKPHLQTDAVILNNQTDTTNVLSTLIFTVDNTPAVSLVNLTGMPLIKLSQDKEIKKEQIDHMLSQQLEASDLFQLKSTVPTKKTFADSIKIWKKEKSTPTLYPTASLLIEAKLIINKSDSSSNQIGTTLNIQAFDQANGDVVANIRTHRLMFFSKKNLSSFIEEAVRELSIEVSTNWQSR